MANKPIFMIMMLFASITLLFIVTILSSYSMDGVENMAYGSTLPPQDEETTGEIQNNLNGSESSPVGNDLSELNSNPTSTTVGCTPGYGYDPNSPNPVCVPLDGSEKPDGVITCSALGCPYNPPNPNEVPG